MRDSREKSLEQSIRELISLNAPVITGLKPAGIINVSEEEYYALGRLFMGSSIRLLPLFHGRRVTLFFYREERLRELLALPELRSFLTDGDMGYEELSMEAVLRRFRLRFRRYKRQEAGFPHEVGALLGYPIEDVRAYLLNEGANAKLTGYWKVYGDPSSALRTFQAYDISIQSFRMMAGHGISLKQMIGICSRRSGSNCMEAVS